MNTSKDSSEFGLNGSMLRLENVRPIIEYDGSEVKDIEKYLARFKKQVDKAIKSETFPPYFDAPVGCQMELTYRCNQRCLHCYNRSGECTTQAKELTIEEWVEVAKQLVEMNIFECIISGGEPTLLKDDLMKIMDPIHDSGADFVFITNGMLANKKFIDKMKKYNFEWFQVSIDGADSNVHDFIRQAPGSWKKAVKAAQLVKEAGFPLVISHCVTRQNVSQVGEMIDLAYYLGAVRIILGPFMNSGRAILNHDKLSLSKSQVEHFEKVHKAKVKKYLYQMRVMTAMDTALGFRYLTSAPTRTMLIRPNGDVRLDCSLPFKIGNVREQSLVDIWNQRGKNAWKSKMLLSYVYKIASEDDLMRVRPRPYVDDDLLLEVN